jgi:hypothetical protein
VSQLNTPEWNAKILKALKENSRRFANAGKTARKRTAGDLRRTGASKGAKDTAARRRA